MADEYDEGSHPDAKQDAEQLRPIVEALVQAVQLLAAKIDHIEGAHGALEKLVTDDLIGGIHSMYVAKMRGDRIEGLKTKFGGDLQGHFDVLKDLSPEGFDHWGALADMTDGMDDEGVAGHVKGLAEGLASKLAKIRGNGGGSVEVKTETVPEAPAEEAAEEAPGGETSEEPKLSKDEKIAKALSTSKGFKIR